MASTPLPHAPALPIPDLERLMSHTWSAERLASLPEHMGAIRLAMQMYAIQHALGSDKKARLLGGCLNTIRELAARGDTEALEGGYVFALLGGIRLSPEATQELCRAFLAQGVDPRPSWPYVSRLVASASGAAGPRGANSGGRKSDAQLLSGETLAMITSAAMNAAFKAGERWEPAGDATVQPTMSRWEVCDQVYRERLRKNPCDPTGLYFMACDKGGTSGNGLFPPRSLGRPSYALHPLPSGEIVTGIRFDSEQYTKEFRKEIRKGVAAAGAHLVLDTVSSCEDGSFVSGANSGGEGLPSWCFSCATSMLHGDADDVSDRVALVTWVWLGSRDAIEMVVGRSKNALAARALKDALSSIDSEVSRCLEVIQSMLAPPCVTRPSSDEASFLTSLDDSCAGLTQARELLAKRIGVSPDLAVASVPVVSRSDDEAVGETARTELRTRMRP